MPRSDASYRDEIKRLKERVQMHYGVAEDLRSLITELIENVPEAAKYIAVKESREHWGRRVPVAIKTIEPPSPAKVYRIRCSTEECNALLECSKGDLKYEGDQRDGASWHLTCPHCHHKTYVYDLKKYEAKAG